MGRGIFITGTDTGVGKTLVAGGLAAALREKGIDIGVMKPVESGCPRKDGRLIPQDALFLRDMAGCQGGIGLLNQYALEHPLAPAVAAEMEGKEVMSAGILAALKTLLSRHDLVLVEGVGGLAVPLRNDYVVADLSKELGLPLLIVVRAGLGTISHTLLTLSYARQKGLKVVGLVMNHTSPIHGIAETTNVSAIKRWADAPLLGVLPFLGTVSRDSITRAVEENLDLGPIQRIINERISDAL